MVNVNTIHFEWKARNRGSRAIKNHTYHHLEGSEEQIHIRE